MPEPSKKPEPPAEPAPAATPAAQKAAAEKLAQKENVKKALQQTTPGEAKPEREGHRWTAFTVYAVLLVVFAVLDFLIQREILPVPLFKWSWLGNVPHVAVVAVLLLLVERSLEMFAIRRVTSAVTRYNVVRIARLLVALAIVGAGGSLLFGNFYTGLVSLGVISIIVGLAIQTPMTSFFGWIYILIRAPYRVGDRIKIDDATGDVIEVSYLDTTLWEFGGQYLSTDHPSGRIIKFPNSKVLNSMVYNYSWPLFPYIWNEIKVNIAYESDLDFVSKVMKEVVMEHRGEKMARRVKVFRELLSRTPVDELSVNDYPEVIFRVSENTWLEAIVRYLVDPKHAGGIKTELLKKILARLKAEPDRVLFPKGSSR